MSRLTYYADLYWTYLKIAVKQSLQYRIDFLLGVVAALATQGSKILFISLIFSRIARLRGWGLWEIVLAYGFLTTSYNFGAAILGFPWSLHGQIRYGYLDTLLVRPASTLFQLVGGFGVDLMELSNAVIGPITIVVALTQLGLSLDFWRVVYLLVCVVSGTLLTFSLSMVIACTGFWVFGFRSALYPTFWLGEFGSYPIGIFPLAIRSLLTWVLPWTMVGFYPAAFLLGREEFRLEGLVAPVIGFVWFAASMVLWRIGTRRYQSAGS